MRLGMVYKTGWCMDAEDIRGICIQSYNNNYGHNKIFKTVAKRVSLLYPDDNWYREKPLAYMRVQ